MPGAISSSPSTKRTRRSKFSRTSSTTSAGSTIRPISPRPAGGRVQNAGRVASGPERELGVLHPEPGTREGAEVAGVVVVQVGEDDVADVARVDAELGEHRDRVRAGVARGGRAGLTASIRVD